MKLKEEIGGVSTVVNEPNMSGTRIANVREVSHQANSAAESDERFRRVLKIVFLSQKRYDMVEMARGCDISVNKLESFVSGDELMPISILRRITELSGDSIFLDAAFAGSPIKWSWGEQATHKSERTDVDIEAARVCISKIAARLQCALSAAKLPTGKHRMLSASIKKIEIRLQKLTYRILEQKKR